MIVEVEIVIVLPIERAEAPERAVRHMVSEWFAELRG
jgi:hypothetical protein